MKSSRQVYLYFIVTTVNLISFSIGWTHAWPTPIMPILLGRTGIKQNPLPYSISLHESCWITSLFHLSACFSPAVAAFLAMKLGPKMTLLVFSVPMIFANALIVFASRIEHFFISRILSGFGCGAMFTIIPMFVVEISDPDNRGRFGCFMYMMMTLAALLCYSVGGTLNVRSTGYFGLIPLILFVIIFILFVPESPYYYVSKKNMKGAEMALMQLYRRPKQQIAEELENISNSVQEELGFTSLYKLRNARKAVFICMTLIFFQLLSGLPTIIAFFYTVFDEGSNNFVFYIALIILGSIQLISVAITSVLVDKLGRRFFLLTSTLGCFTSMIVLAIYIFFYQKGYYFHYLIWVLLTFIIVYIMSYNGGIGPLPWVLMSELIPTNIKYHGSSLVATFALVLNFIMELTYPKISEMIGILPCLATFAACTLAQMLFVYYTVPETRKKSLEDIQRELVDGRQNKRRSVENVNK